MEKVAEHKAEAERLFFALWPSAVELTETQRVVNPLLKGAKGRILPSENWHVTLNFLGHVDVGRKQHVIEVANQASVGKFELVFDAIRYRKNAHMIWLEAGRTPEALRDLLVGLGQSLTQLGFIQEERAFLAHMTLMRKVVYPGRLPTDIDPIVWNVNQFVLVRSTTLPDGARYETICKWELH